jgi:hypothetical protein
MTITRIIIHDSPGYQLAARTTSNPVVGTTVELFAKHPKAQRPRWQRISCFTLPPESFRSLAEVFDLATVSPGPSWGHQRPLEASHDPL